MRVAVTGATGFIGRHLARALLANGDTVTALLRPESNAACLPPDVRRLGYDALAGADLAFDAVVHCAAIRHRWGTREEDYRRVNVEQVRQLVETLGTRAGRFVLVSSIAVFGWPSRLPIDESFPCAPLGPYGASKVACEEWLRAHARANGLPYAIVRPSITYGPEDPTGMVSKLCRLVAKGRYVRVGRGLNRVQLIYVDDLCRALRLAAQSPDAAGTELIVSSPEPIRTDELAKLCARAVGRRLPPFWIPARLVSAAGGALEAVYRLGLKPTGPEPFVTPERVAVLTTDRCYDVSRAERTLGFRASIGYEEGVRRTMTWVLGHVG